MAMDSVVKQEIAEPPLAIETVQTLAVPEKDSAVIDLSSSDSGSPDLDDSVSPGVAMAGKQPKALDCAEEGPVKKQKLEVTLPPGFLEPLPAAPLSTPAVSAPPAPLTAGKNREVGSLSVQSCKHFWKAGDYEGDSSARWEVSSGGMDHVRVHPKFLHSNATSHKWALGAFAELLDNALDEVCNGATYVNIDMLENKKDGNSMLLIEDNGGGMNPDKMRQCMSLGYSVKSKLANTIGQYGNGFKTSTMRLGADVIVFSRCCGQAEKGPTQSIGLLSYTFLRSTGKEDIVVPMLDYERVGNQWKKIQRASVVDWNRNMETVVHWSPYFDEADLLQQFNAMKDHGTRIIIYNLWEDDEQQLELDFYADKHDIQIRGVNRDERNIQMAKQFPNSRHFLTYRHSLRSYVSILYLRLPPNFRIILRGKDVEHHNIVNDMMMSQEVTYRPQPSAIGIPKDSNMIAVVSIGFVKDAKFHVDVQGFNVYHKNRLIKPFWRLWNASGSDGRGVIGVLEANFVEPAHDKQGFERTTVLSRLEARLMQMQKNYWSDNCHKIGYAPRRSRTVHVSAVKGTSPDHLPETALHLKKKAISSSSKVPLPDSYKFSHKHGTKGFEGSSVAAFDGHGNGHICVNLDDEVRANNSSHYKSTVKSSLGNDQSLSALSTPYSANTEATQYLASKERTVQTLTGLQLKPVDLHLNDAGSSLLTMQQLEEENRNLRIRLHSIEGEVLGEILQDLQFERDRSKTLEKQLEETSRKMEEMNKEQDNLIDIFSEERERRNNEEGNLRKKLKEASCTIQELLDKVKLLERVKSEG